MLACYKRQAAIRLLVKGWRSNARQHSYSTASSEGWVHENVGGMLQTYLQSIETPEYLDTLYQGVVARDRLSLSRTLTLCESSRPEHLKQATRLLRKLLLWHRSAGTNSTNVLPSFRVGFSGPPGVGKSSLIESLGCKLAEDMGCQVAVLAVDPSSQRTGGAILGDKTRMPKLSCHPNAYVRPTPTRGTLGGVARATHDAILVCECAGYSTVLVETVGVGQSETAVSDLVDCMILVLPPVGGDELQGVKRGIMEVADVFAVNKADGATQKAAQHTAAEIRGIVNLLPARHRAWRPEVLAVSAASGAHLDDLISVLQRYKSSLTESGELLVQRRLQAERLCWAALEDATLTHLRHHSPTMATLRGLMKEVHAGQLTPRAAAEVALSQLFGPNT